MSTSEIKSDGTALYISTTDDNTASSQPLNTPKLPGRLRRRLLECKSSPVSAQDIDAKLRDADLRRQVCSLSLIFCLPSSFSSSLMYHNSFSLKKKSKCEIDTLFP